MASEKKGVILLNMGGPDSLSDVRPFLFNLFSDREIIRLGPPFLQKPIGWLIAKKRAPKSEALYAKIGGGSPLKKITQAQAEALEKTLASEGNFTVTIGMRYWPPFCDEALHHCLQQEVTHLTVLPLYPHYSKATTGSSLADFKDHLRATAPQIPIDIVESWPKQTSYIMALADNIKEGIEAFHGGKVEIVYSGHSLPVSFIEEGDPYVDHLKQTIAAVEEITGVTGHLCYQSRSGPVEWLSPSTEEMIEELANQRVKNILMVPISFVSDHIETLYEINMLFKEQAEKLGVTLLATKSLNTHPRFIQGLKELVLSVQR